MPSAPKIILLSDGARPTEDIYFLKSAVPFLKKHHDFQILRFNCNSAVMSSWMLRLPQFKNAHLIIVRSIPSKSLSFLEQNRYGFSSITYIIDDDFSAALADDVQSTLPDVYIQKISRLYQIQRRILALANTVVASCEFLRLKLSFAHDNVQLLPPSFLHNLPKLQHFHGDASQIVYPGTRAHSFDLAMIIPALKQINAEPKNHRDISVSCMLGRHLPESLKGQPFIQNQPAMTWHQFFSLQKSRRFHIGLAPLMETSFNRGKSWNKLLDITAFGAVGVFSDRAPYKDIVRDGLNGLLVDDDSQSWEESLRRLLAYPADTLQMARAAQQTVKSLADPLKCYEFWHQLFNG